MNNLHTISGGWELTNKEKGLVGHYQKDRFRVRVNRTKAGNLSFKIYNTYYRQWYAIRAVYLNANQLRNGLENFDHDKLEHGPNL